MLVYTVFLQISFFCLECIATDIRVSQFHDTYMLTRSTADSQR
jgi:hypothetical protein